ncbi:beta family protein [Actinoallomurus sp. CA-150999]|uniref:beta family protein n=1 Tax=Actinoallomurus sp. CA-150999 TaxID=3239887 RepID=UPI003D8A1B12
MTVYMPVLQARQGELIALGKLDSAAVPLVQPVLEAVCYKAGEPLWRAAMRLADLAAREVLKGTVVSVDCVHLDRHYGAADQDGQTPMDAVAGALKQMLIPMRPVLRFAATGGPSPQACEVAGELADAHGQGACVRAVLRGWGEAGAVLADQVAVAVDRLGCGPERLDLLLDLGPVTERSQIPYAVRAAGRAVSALAGLPWRRTAVAAAAFPDSITSVPLGGSVPFARLDADIWRQLKAGEQTWAGALSFGDYGVAGTRLPKPGVFRPAPNLRYTAPVCWHTYRYPTDAGGRFSTFYDLCREVTGKLWWAGEAYSWGDAQIALRAKGNGGPGGASQWRAFSLSHHLAVVLEELGGVAC